MTIYKNYLFVNHKNGEGFIITAKCIKECKEILLSDLPDEYQDAVFEGILTDEEAEASGLDNY